MECLFVVVVGGEGASSRPQPCQASCYGAARCRAASFAASMLGGEGQETACRIIGAPPSGRGWASTRLVYLRMNEEDREWQQRQQQKRQQQAPPVVTHEKYTTHLRTLLLC
eukprot:jgi/Mesen1/1748/ME001390S00743